MSVSGTGIATLFYQKIWRSQQGVADYIESIQYNENLINHPTKQ